MPKEPKPKPKRRRPTHNRSSPRPTIFKPLLTAEQMLALDAYFKQVTKDQDQLKASGRIIINKVFNGCTQYQTRIALGIYADIARAWCHVEKHSNAFTYYFSAYQEDQPHDAYVYVDPEDIDTLNAFIASHLEEGGQLQLDAYTFDRYQVKLKTSKRNLWILLWLVLSLNDNITVTKKSYRKQEEAQQGALAEAKAMPKQQVISYTIQYNNRDMNTNECKVSNNKANLR